jgi:hypothetical protein
MLALPASSPDAEGDGERGWSVGLPYLTHFNMTEMVTKEEDVGNWLITQEGRRFVEGRSVHARALAYHGDIAIKDKRREITF